MATNFYAGGSSDKAWLQDFWFVVFQLKGHGRVNSTDFLRGKYCNSPCLVPGAWKVHARSQYASDLNWLESTKARQLSQHDAMLLQLRLPAKDRKTDLLPTTERIERVLAILKKSKNYDLPFC